MSRAVGGLIRPYQGTFRPARRVVWCTVVRHDVPVARQRVHTREFSAEARERLGLAITRAREASGHPYRPSFARAAGLSVRSIVNLETGNPVGPSVYEAAARALPGWTEDTPRTILEGGAAPSTLTMVPTEPLSAGVNELMLRHLHDQRAYLATIDATDAEIDEYLVALRRLWISREPDQRRFLRTLQQFISEVDQETSPTNHSGSA
jgi:hypothetical protein